MASEPSLRGCRTDSCRSVISEQLALVRLIDVTVQAPRQKEIVASVAIFDPSARGIAADTEREIKRSEDRLETAVTESVEQVIATQRLTAPLRIEIRPPDAKAKVADGRGTVRELTEAERTGKTPVRLFLGGYQVRAEKPGFSPQEVRVTLGQGGSTVQLELVPSPILVRFEWAPAGATLRVDNRPVSVSIPEIELSEGPHRVEVLAPQGQPYESIVRNIEVVRNMEPVRLVLRRLTELHIQAPLGYSVSVDQQILAKELFSEQGLRISTAYKTTPGLHVVTARSFRNLAMTQKVDVRQNTSTEVVFRPPPVWPALLVMAGGLAIIGGGVGVYYQPGPCIDTECFLLRDYRPIGYGLMVAGSATFVSGLVYLAINVASNPRFFKPASRRVSVSPFRTENQTGILTTLRF